MESFSQGFPHLLCRAALFNLHVTCLGRNHKSQRLCKWSSYPNLASICNTKTKTFGQVWPYLPLLTWSLLPWFYHSGPHTNYFICWYLVLSGSPDFLDWSALPSVFQWQWWNKFRPEGFMGNSDKRHRLRALLCLLCTADNLQLSGNRPVASSGPLVA